MLVSRYQVTLVGCLFMTLEVALLVYQLLRCRVVAEWRRYWPSLLVLLALLGWNAVAGWPADLFKLVTVNAVGLLLATLLMLLPVALWRRVRPAPVVPVWSEPTELFLENCRQAQLTARETEVVLAIRKGLKNKEIAEALFISEKTVDAHIQNIYGKVGVRGRLALIQRLSG